MISSDAGTLRFTSAFRVMGHSGKTQKPSNITFANKDSGQVNVSTDSWPLLSRAARTCWAGRQRHFVQLMALLSRASVQLLTAAGSPRAQDIGGRFHNAYSSRCVQKVS